MVLEVLEGRSEGMMWPLLYQRLGLMSKIIPHNTIFLPTLHNILSHTLHIMFLMHNQLHPLLIHNGMHQLHKIIHPPHKFIKILLESLSVLDHNTKREMALKMSSLLLGSRVLACSKN